MDQIQDGRSIDWMVMIRLVSHGEWDPKYTKVSQGYNHFNLLEEKKKLK